MSNLKVKGTLPDSIGNFTDIQRFAVDDNAIEGPIPHTVGSWKNLLQFTVCGNKIAGAPLPDMNFENMQVCQLLVHNGGNSFNCPWPAGAKAHCKRNDGTTGVWPLVTDNDCLKNVSTCTGLSTQLPQDQCDAWGDFYDALSGDDWKCCSGTRYDPCSCMGCPGGGSTSPVCSADGMAVISM
jgi:hypothetical protein